MNTLAQVFLWQQILVLLHIALHDMPGLLSLQQFPRGSQAGNPYQPPAPLWAGFED